MRTWLIEITEFSIVVIDTMALLIILVGTAEAFVGTALGLIARNLPSQRPTLWLRYARWLVAGLTFQLAADIVESSIAMSWEALGRLAAIAVIRTFLNFFLDRDLADAREARSAERKGPV